MQNMSTESVAPERKAVIPLTERHPNAVDQFAAHIARVQAECGHDMRLTEPVEIPESKKPGVYVLWKESQRSMGAKLSLQCLRCSLPKVVWTKNAKTCPWCLEPLVAVEMGTRLEYFDEDDEESSYAPRLYHCSSCKFMGVYDEWSP